MFVRTATPDDALDVRRILDAAMLDPGDVEERIAAEDVLVAGDRVSTADSADAADAGSTVDPDADSIDASGSNAPAVAAEAAPNAAESTPDAAATPSDASTSSETRERERLLGTIVLEPREHGAYVAAIGVRRRHRNRGIGRTLIETALDREGALTARFDADVRPFYESLGFSVEPIDAHRFRGYRSL